MLKRFRNLLPYCLLLFTVLILYAIQQFQQKAGRINALGTVILNFRMHILSRLYNFLLLRIFSIIIYFLRQYTFKLTVIVGC